MQINSDQTEKVSRTVDRKWQDNSVHWHCFLYNLSPIMPPSLLTCWCQYQRTPFLFSIMAYQLFSLVSKGSNFRLSLGRLYDLICEIISPCLENYCPFHTSVFREKNDLMEEDQGCLCVYPHTAIPCQQISHQFWIQVFSFPVVTSLAIDSIQFLICKKYKKIGGTVRDKHSCCF